ncbi:hypothetical protein ACWEKR_13355 [Nocardia sp. NPDC004573]
MSNYPITTDSLPLRRRCLTQLDRPEESAGLRRVEPGDSTGDARGRADVTNLDGVNRWARHNIRTTAPFRQQVRQRVEPFIGAYAITLTQWKQLANDRSGRLTDPDSHIHLTTPLAQEAHVRFNRCRENQQTSRQR